MTVSLTTSHAIHGCHLSLSGYGLTFDLSQLFLLNDSHLCLMVLQVNLNSITDVFRSTLRQFPNSYEIWHKDSA